MPRRIHVLLFFCWSGGKNLDFLTGELLAIADWQAVKGLLVNCLLETLQHPASGSYLVKEYLLLTLQVTEKCGHVQRNGL